MDNIHKGGKVYENFRTSHCVYVYKEANDPYWT